MSMAVVTDMCCKLRILNPLKLKWIEKGFQL